jgi:hypothetical protein
MFVESFVKTILLKIQHWLLRNSVIFSLCGSSFLIFPEIYLCLVVCIFQKMTLNMVCDYKNGDRLFTAAADGTTKIQGINEPKSFCAHTCGLLLPNDQNTITL